MICVDPNLVDDEVEVDPADEPEPFAETGMAFPAASDVCREGAGVSKRGNANMTKIVRTPSRAAGGITPEEKLRLDEHALLWISRAMRTAPIEPGKIVPAIEALLCSSRLEKTARCNCAIASSYGVCLRRC